VRSGLRKALPGDQRELCDVRTDVIRVRHLARNGGRGVGLSDDPIWPHLDNWAAELGLSGPDAVSGRPSQQAPATKRAVYISETALMSVLMFIDVMQASPGVGGA
jgi:hypothetical protein